MKISLSWTLDHLNCKALSELGVELEQLQSLFNQRVAEIEGFSFLNIDKNKFFAAKVLEASSDKASAEVPELGMTVSLDPREDAEASKVFLVHGDKKNLVWAEQNILGLSKDGLFPEMHISQDELAGSWKDSVEWDDVILEVDNKSITHRPDMWSHRGFAREIALLCKAKLIPSDDLLEKISVQREEKSNKISNPGGGLSVDNQTPDTCKQFCAARFSKIDHRPSDPKMAFRLARTGFRAINLIVDLTNYLTGDWGQPVHAFDANQMPDGHITVRKASKGETLTLLGNETIELTDKDMVVANKDGASSLAGIKGGQNDSILNSTEGVIFESANFDSTTIRRTAQHHKIRTESSSRFEKTLHKNLALEGVLRFLKIAQDFDVEVQVSGPILCLGQPDKEVDVSIQHSFLENRIGVTLSESDVVKPLSKLGFIVNVDQTHDQLLYNIGVPDFRSAKDVGIAEDIVEEVARCHGFEKIEPKLPLFEKQPTDTSARTKLGLAKNFLAYSANMIEQYNYLFFNQDIIDQIKFDPGQTLTVKNPVNENTVKLVTTLIPGLFGNLAKNYHLSDELAFFECARTWNIDPKTSEHSENDSIAGVFWSKRKDVDFFKCKETLTKLLEIFGFCRNDISWEKVKGQPFPWAHPHATSSVSHKGNPLGIAGKISRVMWPYLDFLPSSDAFFFELDLAALKNHKPDLTKAQPIPKAQEQSFDLAFLTVKEKTVDGFKKHLQSIDSAVKSVIFLDEFTKDEWGDKKSLAFRVKLQGSDDELSRQKVDSILEKAKEVVSKNGAELRA